MKQATRGGPKRPDSAEQFVTHLRALVDAGKHREAVVYAERFSREFLPQLSNEEHSRVTGMMEGAATIVDLEDWEAGENSAARVARPAGADERAVHATRD